MWPFHHLIPIKLFWSTDIKKIIIPDQENCLVLPPWLRKPLSHRLVVWFKAEQWVFFGVHTGPQRCAHLSFCNGHSQEHEACPGLQLWLFSGEEQSQKASEEYQTGKKVLVWHLLPTEGHNQEPHSKASVESLPCWGLYALCNIQNHIWRQWRFKGSRMNSVCFLLIFWKLQIHPLIFTRITCPGLHISSSALYPRAQGKPSFCPRLENWAMMKPVKPVSHCNPTQAEKHCSRLKALQSSTFLLISPFSDQGRKRACPGGAMTLF